MIYIYLGETEVMIVSEHHVLMNNLDNVLESCDYFISIRHVENDIDFYFREIRVFGFKIGIETIEDNREMIFCFSVYEHRIHLIVMSAEGFYYVRDYHI
jgi:hypothetical protein